MKIFSYPYFLSFKRPFKIAHGVRTETPVVFLEIELDGHIGYGEASLPPYLIENQQTVATFFEKAKPILNAQKDLNELAELIKEIDAIEPGNTAAKAAIDIALHDLKGKLTSLPLWKIFGTEKENSGTSTMTIGVDEPAALIEKVNEAKDFPLLKVKLDGIHDREIIQTIRSVSKQSIAVDVNQGWKDREQAIRSIEWLSTQEVLFVEQPMPKEHIEDAHWLSQRSPLPLYADESVQRLVDMEPLKDIYAGFNIKLMKCSGLAEAQQMIRLGKSMKKKLLIGCMSESSCAVSAAAQLSAFTDHADLDGPLLINNDPFTGISFEKGKIVLNDQAGIGVKKRA